MLPVTHAHGKQGEDLAYSFLSQNGYAILERNYRISGGEIDLIAKKDAEVVFVEVKTRASSRYGYPEESVGAAKKKRLVRAARTFLGRFSSEPLYRFDIIAVQIEQGLHAPKITHIENFLDDIAL